MSGALAELNSAGFNEFISGTPVSVVDFSATWCGPCQVLKPTIEALAGEMAGKVNIGKLDIDGAPEIASQFGVTSVPTIIFFKDGQQVDSMIGVVPKDKIAAKINSLL